MKKIPVDIYHCEVLTFNDYNDLKRYCKRMDANIPESEYSYVDLSNLHNTSGGVAGVITYPEKEPDLFLAVDSTQYSKDGVYDYPDFMDAVSHECFHMTYFILDSVGVEIDGDNHEAACYLLGYLVRKYLELHKIFSNKM